MNKSELEPQAAAIVEKVFAPYVSHLSARTAKQLAMEAIGMVLDECASAQSKPTAADTPVGKLLATIADGLRHAIRTETAEAMAELNSRFPNKFIAIVHREQFYPDTDLSTEASPRTYSEVTVKIGYLRSEPRITKATLSACMAELRERGKMSNEN